MTTIIVKATGEEKIAVYGPNSGGNMRYNVDGKFYSDKKFNSLFEIKIEKPKWHVHTANLLKEIIEYNENMGIFFQPINIFKNILAEVAARAIELNDHKLNVLMCRLHLYEETEETMQMINK